MDLIQGWKAAVYVEEDIVYISEGKFRSPDQEVCFIAVDVALLQ